MFTGMRGGSSFPFVGGSPMGGPWSGLDHSWRGLDHLWRARGRRREPIELVNHRARYGGARSRSEFTHRGSHTPLICAWFSRYAGPWMTWSSSFWALGWAAWFVRAQVRVVVVSQVRVVVVLSKRVGGFVCSISCGRTYPYGPNWMASLDYGVAGVALVFLRVYPDGTRTHDCYYVWVGGEVFVRIFPADLRSAKHLVLIGWCYFDQMMMVSADVSRLS